MESSPLPPVRSGVDVRKVVAEQRIAAREANEKLDASKTWYEELRKEWK